MGGVSTARGATSRELATRLVACSGFRWLPGMLVVDALGNRTRLVEGSIDVQLQYIVGLHGYALPVLDDPATLGCLLALVRAAWGDLLIVTDVLLGRWRVVRRRVISEGTTEFEALVVALESAPKENDR